jgi:hypothetical protein
MASNLIHRFISSTDIKKTARKKFTDIKKLHGTKKTA